MNLGKIIVWLVNRLIGKNECMNVDLTNRKESSKDFEKKFCNNGFQFPWDSAADKVGHIVNWTKTGQLKQCVIYP